MSSASLISLPMYNLPELAAETEALISVLANRIQIETGIKAEIILDNNADVADLWHLDNCLFSQSCGYPLVHGFHDHIQALAIPNYDIKDCVPGHYRSVFIVEKNSGLLHLSETRGLVAAINGWDSQSGFNTLRHSLLPLNDETPFFGSVVVSGGHRDSIRLVASGDCNIAAIDGVTFDLVKACNPEELKNIRVISHSAPAPCLPFVTSVLSDTETITGLQKSLDFVFKDPDLAEVRNRLLLRSFSPAVSSSYDSIRAMAVAGEKFQFTKM